MNGPHKYRELAHICMIHPAHDTPNDWLLRLANLLKNGCLARIRPPDDQNAERIGSGPVACSSA